MGLAVRNVVHVVRDTVAIGLLCTALWGIPIHILVIEPRVRDTAYARREVIETTCLVPPVVRYPDHITRPLDTIQRRLGELLFLRPAYFTTPRRPARHGPRWFLFRIGMKKPSLPSHYHGKPRRWMIFWRDANPKSIADPHLEGAHRMEIRWYLEALLEVTEEKR